MLHLTVTIFTACKCSVPKFPVAKIKPPFCVAMELPDTSMLFRKTLTMEEHSISKGRLPRYFYNTLKLIFIEDSTLISSHNMEPADLCEPLKNVLTVSEDCVSVTVIPTDVDRNCLSSVIKITGNGGDTIKSSESLSKGRTENIVLRNITSDKLKQKIPWKKISFKLATGVDCDDKIQPVKSNSMGYNNKRQRKLINDLSVPVKSPYASKIMKQMGWDGGSLGLRGDGIIAPLIPQLNCVPGAGFGHHLTTSKINTSKKTFKINRLTDILYILTYDVDEKLVLYENEILKREMNFINHALTAFNNRLSVKLKSSEEKDLKSKILEELCVQKNVRCLGFVSEDLKQLKLKKIILNDTYETRSSKALMKTIAETKITEDHELHITEETYTNILKQIILPFGPSFFKKPTLDDITFKSTILVEIMKFAKSPILERSLKFQFLTDSEREFVVKVVSSLNNRSNLSSEEFLRILYAATQECVGKIYLKVVDTDNTVVLRKLTKTVFMENKEQIALQKKQKNRDNGVFKNDAMANDPILKEGDDPTIENLKTENLPKIKEKSKVTPKKKSSKGKHMKIMLTPTKYPDKIVDHKFLVKLSSILSSRPPTSDKKGPKSHGIHKGGVLIACKSDTFEWLSAMCDKNKIKVVPISRVSSDVIKMAMTVHVDIDLKTDCSCVLDILTSCYKKLRTKRWLVVEKEQFEHYVKLKLEIDVKSFNFLLNSGFVLDASNIKYEFNYI